MDQAVLIRVTFVSGECCSLQVSLSSTIGDLRAQLWNKKANSFGGDKFGGKFRLLDAEVYFNDFEPLSRMVKLAEAFAKDQSIQQKEVVYVPKAHFYDDFCRRTGKVNQNLPVRHCGYLLKNSGGRRSNWQRRFFVYQNCTLYWYTDEKSYQRNDDAKGYLEVGGIEPKTEHPELAKIKKPHVFVLDLPEHLRGTGGKKSKDKNHYMLAAEGALSLQEWMDVFKQGLFFRRVAVMLMTIPALSNAEVLGTEGIFRLAADRAKVTNLERDIERANFPDFYSMLNMNGHVNHSNVHVVADVMKRSMKYMVTPLIPFAFYQNFIQAAFDKGDKQVGKLQQHIRRLPALNRALLEELFMFAHLAKDFSQTSYMTSDNLAIVFAPNILRPEVETSVTMMDSDSKNRVTSLMIEKAPKFFVQAPAPAPQQQPPSFRGPQAGIPPPKGRGMKPPPKMKAPPPQLSSLSMKAPPMLSGSSSAVAPAVTVAKPQRDANVLYGDRPRDDEELEVAPYTSYGANNSYPQEESPSDAFRELSASSSFPQLEYNSLPNPSKPHSRAQSTMNQRHHGLPQVQRNHAATVSHTQSNLSMSNASWSNEKPRSSLFRLGHSSSPSNKPHPPRTKPPQKSPQNNRFQYPHAAPHGLPRRAKQSSASDAFAHLSDAELKKEIQNKEQEKTQTERLNQEILQRTEAIRLHCGSFQSTFEHKLDEYLSETVSFYNDQSQAFAALIENNEVPEKDIQTQLEKLHEKVKKTLKEHMASLGALSRFYENCTTHLSRISVTPTAELEQNITEMNASLQERAERAKRPPKPPQPPAPPPAAKLPLAVATADYNGGYHHEKELIFRTGDRILLTVSEDQSGWLQGKLERDPNSVPGWLPTSYVQKM